MMVSMMVYGSARGMVPRNQGSSSLIAGNVKVIPQDIKFRVGFVSSFGKVSYGSDRPIPSMCHLASGSLCPCPQMVFHLSWNLHETLNHPTS